MNTNKDRYNIYPIKSDLPKKTNQQAYILNKDKILAAQEYSATEPSEL